MPAGAKIVEKYEKVTNKGENGVKRRRYTLTVTRTQRATGCVIMAVLLGKNRYVALILLMATSFSTGSLTQSRSQNREFQRAVKNDKIIFALEGVRARALNSVKPDPILLINFPEIDEQFKVNTGQASKNYIC